ncbi:aromatic acid exporter family protein [Gorillibacterium sp. sgz5001074]|uniref:aromatic acid exporter family protein n=1 Tax=Gorillibacterium sp. sgz5001074 TaxID=3446695 RepID=UPI003F679E9C
MTLGARVLKTGLSITLSLYVCYWLGFTPGVFAAVAAVFTVQPTVYRTWRQVLDQVQTNTLGAAVALAANTLFGDSPISIGLVAVFVIMASLRLKMENTISLTLVTVLAIMEAPGDDWAFALNRFLIILIGMGSAFLVNLLILPPKHGRTFAEGVRRSFQLLSLLHRTAISNELTEKAFREQHEDFRKSLAKLDDQFGSFDEERRKLGRIRPTDVRELIVFKQMLHVLHKGDDTLEIIGDHYFRSARNGEESRIFDEQLEALTRYHEQLLLRYEGKLKEAVPPDSGTLEAGGGFMNRVMDQYRKEPENRMGLILVGSAIFEYGYQLNRLDKVLEAYIRNAPGAK